MTLKCDKYAIDIINLRRPTPLEKLADEIPKPEGAIPNFGLPKWKEMPLESKIPMVPGPEGAYNFTRTKLGKRLWISAPDAEFNLSDPYSYEMEMPYDSLHDKHLLPYFSRPNNIRHLLKAGLITKNLDAKCSLRDYNMYRKYLRKLHCDSIKEELSNRAKWSSEERAIQYAQEQAQKEVNKLKEREKFTERRRAIIRDRELAEKLKRQEQKDNQRKIAERLRALLQKRRDAQHLQLIQSKARADMIEQKQKAAADIERKKIIHTLLDWSRKERIRKRTREKRLAFEQEEKHRTIEQKWQERHEFQEKEIEKKQFLIQCIETRRKKFVEKYNEKVNKEQQRMKKLFRDVRMFIKCYLTRYVTGSKERICCKKYWDDDDDDDDAMKGKETVRLQSRKPGKKTPIAARHSYRTSMIQDRDKRTVQRKKKKVEDKADVTVKELKKLKKKMKMTHSKIKKRKRITGSDQEGGEKGRKRKKKRGRRRKRKLKRRVGEEEKSELGVEESVSTAKEAEASDASEDTLKEECRCEMIKLIQKLPAT